MTADSLPGLLADAARVFGERPAVRCRNRELTYAELDAAASAVAAALAEGGVRPGDRVVLWMPKAVEAVAALYGIMRAGAAYVPLDPRAPVARIADVVRDCAPVAAVTSAGVLDRLAETGVAPSVVLATGDVSGRRDARPFPSFRAGASPQGDPAPPPGRPDLAYILYTSGSTGLPKGVELTHGNALAFVEWARDRIGAAPADRFANHAPLHFDLSVLDLFLPPMAGAALVMITEEEASFAADLVRLVREEAITFWYSVPSALRMMTRAAAGSDALSGLRTVAFAGEVYPAPHVRELASAVPSASLWNLYGPTESNVCTYHRVTSIPDDDEPLPIGIACENGTEVFAVRDDGRQASPGEHGELYVRGPTVMRGYRNRPDETAAALVPDPRGSQGTAYRTGDLVRLRTDGAFDFAGRRDHQVKSRGYRIELGEVETVLAAAPGIEEAAVVALPHPEWGTELVAWVAGRPEGAADPAAVRRYLASRLPPYMLPARIEVREGLPRTSTGKVDRRTLEAEAGGR